jgi:hypothetical protein
MKLGILDACMKRERQIQRETPNNFFNLMKTFRNNLDNANFSAEL